MTRTTAFSWLLAALFPIYGGLQTATASAQETDQACDPIGRIVQGNSQEYRQGEIICDGTQIINPVEFLFMCFSNNQTVALAEDAVINLDTCRNEQATVARACPHSNLSQPMCFRPKGTTEQFSLIEPDAVSHDARPEISWHPVPETVSYAIYVTGNDINWRRTVTAATAISYPTDENALTIGNAYEVRVTAHRDEAGSMATASRVINIQSDSANISLQLAEMVPSRMGD